MPMNFTIDEENRFVVVTFRKSQKIRNFERDPRAAEVGGGPGRGGAAEIIPRLEADGAFAFDNLPHNRIIHLRARSAGTDGVDVDVVFRELRGANPRHGDDRPFGPGVRNV